MEKIKSALLTTLMIAFILADIYMIYLTFKPMYYGLGIYKMVLDYNTLWTPFIIGSILVGLLCGGALVSIAVSLRKLTK